MSGICVLIHFDNSPVDTANLQKMVEAAAYRGPDGITYWTSHSVGLAYLALRATPESLQERQPLLNGDGSLCLVADARIDNRAELLPILLQGGYLHNPQATDAEIILAAYERWQEACPEQLIGDFAFAIWDGRKQQLFCARDPFGMKMLHYGRAGSLFGVATEAQQLLHHPAFPRHLEEKAVADHLVGNFSDETTTMFQGIFRLASAHRLVVTAQREQTDRYWDVQPEIRIRYRHDTEYAAHFLALFRRAVADRLRTHRPVIGAEVSGGMDSSSITAVAQDILKHQTGSPRLVACSYAFDQFPECDERAYTQALAAHSGVEIHYVPAEQFWLLDDPNLFRPTLETPYLTWESVEHAILRHFQQLGAQVLLTGHSAERIILGTPLVYADRFWHGQLGVLWELARLANAPYHRVLFNYLLEPVLPDRFMRTVRRRLGRDRAGRLPPWLAPDFVKRTGLMERLTPPPAARPNGTLAQQAIYQKLFRHNPNRRIFYWYDRLAARYGMEARHPFLDRRLAEFILAIPPDQLFHQGYYKMLVRRAMTGILPDSIRWRLDKTQFNRYTSFNWEKAAEQIQQLITEPLLSTAFGFVDANKLLERYAAYRTSHQDISPHELWPAVTMELWLKTYDSFIR